MVEEGLASVGAAWSHCLHSQEVVGWGEDARHYSPYFLHSSRTPAYRMVLLTLRVALPSLDTPF